MRTEQLVAISRHDYQASAWSVPAVHLHFDLHPQRTRVSSTLELRRETSQPVPTLRLDGVDLSLIDIKLDGQTITPGDYKLDDTHLTLENLPESCKLEITTQINPAGNTALEGLYLSSGNFCTQCEAEGFRKITYFLDRPDVLSVYTVTMKAPYNEYPILLSNGNFVEASSDKEYGYAQWHDPHPKPSYLFALVAGNLSKVVDTFTTMSGRNIDLHIYVEQHNLSKCAFAMQALKRSMRWDEQVYGLEYDLERFMIVAVDDFNMGAMENKGLNVFNSRFVLADVDTATDTDFIGVEAVIAHEYFHNWTGNRVTCRDWFQLSLKEGLTVFRDQEFTADMHDRTAKRIEDVRLLRARQFPEDAGPMAHPVRPESFIEINNFYTLTIYEKGAEVIRMMHTMLGASGFRKGIDLYFERHDGQAVTCDDFIAAMQDASGIDLQQFSLWYSQAGTPQVTIDEHYDADKQIYELTLTQHCPDTPGQTNKKPMQIPMLIGLLDEQGNPAAGSGDNDTALLNLIYETQTFTFGLMTTKPILSPFRQFSAPVNLVWNCSDEDLAMLLSADSDGFNQWDASQRLATRVIERTLENSAAAEDALYLEAIGKVISDNSLDAAIKAEILSLPSIDTLAESQTVVDIQKLYRARKAVQAAIVGQYQTQLQQIVQTQLANKQPYKVEHQQIGHRALANCALGLLTVLPEQDWLTLASEQYRTAGNMTDRVAALTALMHVSGEERTNALTDFYQHYEDQRLVIDKWFSIQATVPSNDAVDTVMRLSVHPAFELSNPNRVRSLIGAFAVGNPVGLHSEGGRGYKLLADYVLTLDARNPQVAARMVSPLTRWQR
ncbi:MAG: aminopeptidase N, partial [Granulosicoccaceae bacterium]